MKLNDTQLLRQQCYVGGEWIEAREGGTTAVLNPATGAILGSVPNLGAAEVRTAIEAAAAALPAWRASRMDIAATLARG